MHTTDSAAAAAAGLGRRLGPLRRAVLRATRQAADLPDLPEAQIELLRTLSGAPGGLSPREAAARLRIAPSTLSNLLRSMTASGLVTREQHPDDLRTAVLTASDEARTLLDRYDRASAVALTAAGAGLSAADRQALAAALPVLDRLLVALEQGERASS